MEFIDPSIEEYARSHSSAESELLTRLNRDTYAKILQPRMLSGHLQGRFLSLLSHSSKPDFILEIGTYTGYSALCLAEGLSEKGQLHTIDINEELKDFTEAYLTASPRKEQIVQHIGNALDIIPQLPHTWDMVFIDADKENYLNYYNLVMDRMNKGGMIIADNVLWSGKVLKEDNSKDLETKALKKFNQMVQKDDRVENILLPIRDGLMICRVL